MAKTAESEVIVGLDVGTSKVVAVVGEALPNGQINVLGAGISPSKGIESGVIFDLDAVSNSIQRAVEQAESMADCEISRVTLSISGSDILSLNEFGSSTLSGGVVTQDNIRSADDMAKAIKLPNGMEALHTLSQEYYVDRLPATKNPIGLSGMRLQVQTHLIACPQAWLKNLTTVVERAKLKVDKIAFSGLASSYAVLTDDERELGVCLIDFGGGTMDVLVYTDGSLRFSRVYHYAGNTVTDYLVETFSASRTEAEDLKVNYGSAISPPASNADKRIEVSGLGTHLARTYSRAQITKATSTCYHGLLQMIEDELIQVREHLLKANIKPELIAGVVITGGGSQMEDIVKCAENVFGSQVRVGYPLNITGLTDYVNKPQYATALGLIRYTYNDVEPRVVNEPEDDFFNVLYNVVKKVLYLIKSKF